MPRREGTVDETGHRFSPNYSPRQRGSISEPGHLPTGPRRWADPTRGGRPGSTVGTLPAAPDHLLAMYQPAGPVPGRLLRAASTMPRTDPLTGAIRATDARRGAPTARVLSAASPLHPLRLESLQVRGPNLGTSTTGSAAMASPTSTTGSAKVTSPDMAIRHVRTHTPAKPT